MKLLIISILMIGTSFAEIVKSQIEFNAIGRPSFIKIKGKAKELTQNIIVKDNLLSGSFSFQLDKLKTGLSLRDEHMTENYLETKKYPQAVLTLKDNVDLNKSNAQVKATLLLHGVEKEVLVDFEIDNETKTAQLLGSFSVDIKDFSINIPSFQGITVAKDVKIKVKTKVQK